MAPGTLHNVGATHKIVGGRILLEDLVGATVNANRQDKERAGPPQAASAHAANRTGRNPISKSSLTQAYPRCVRGTWLAHMGFEGKRGGRQTPASNS